jgi:hypothetical protein
MRVAIDRRESLPCDVGASYPAIIANFGALSAPELSGSSIGFLNRRSEVRILPGAP